MLANSIDFICEDKAKAVLPETMELLSDEAHCKLLTSGKFECVKVLLAQPREWHYAPRTRQQSPTAPWPSFRL